MREININRQLLGIEDLLFGFGQVTQTRAGQSIDITKINAGNLPFDETQSLLQWAQTVNLTALGAITVELQAIYNSIDALNNLENNLVALNTLAQAINCLNNLCSNLTKLQNIDTNMTKLQNIDTNMTKLQNIDTNMTKLQNIDTNMLQLSSIYTNMASLQNIDTNMTKLQNIDTNMTKLQNIDTNMLQLSSIYTNMASLQNIYTNMSSLLDINSQIIPHLSEILLVDDYAGQVASDKTTVANDKASVAAMKLAIETIYDTFDDRFLGVKSSDPTLDNDGNPLLDGAMYFNSVSHLLKVYSLVTTTWYSIPQLYLSALLDVTLTSITTGDILTWNGSKWINTRTPSFDSIKLNGGTGTNGTTTWNNTEHTYDIVLNPNVTLQVGQEDLVYCKNNSASVIANGRPVMASGTNGNSGNILVDLHDGTKANARRIVGITTEDLTANGYGFVTKNGKIRGINTTGSQYGETWANGDILYVKATGNLTKVEPADTALKMPIAFVIHAHTNGTLYIRTTGIDENHDRDFISNLVDIHSKTEKTTLVNADEFMTADSTSSFSSKKITWASIKTALTSLFAPVSSPTFSGTVSLPSTTSIGQVSSLELSYLEGVTSAIQAQINYKAATNQTMYIGTTAMAINRATAAQTLTGVSIDGNAATATTATNQTAGNGNTCDAKFKNTPAHGTSFSECNGVDDAPNTGWWLIYSIRHSNSSNYWGTQIAYGWEDNANAIYQRNVRAGSWSAWTRVDASGANITELVNNAGFITGDGRAYPKRVGNVDLNFNWSGQGGQPSWLWGGNDGTNMYVYNPSNFSVNYANSAGNGGVTSVNGMTGAVTVSTSGGIQEFTASGTWTCPAGVTKVTITACGAGGGGSNGTAYYQVLNWTYYGGGGGSSFPITATVPVVPGTTYTIGIGSSGVNSNGGNTTFGTLFCVCGGNAGGPGRITGRDWDGTPSGYEGGYGGASSVTGGISGGSGGVGYWGAASAGLYTSNALSTSAYGAGGGGASPGKSGAMILSW